MRIGIYTRKDDLKLPTLQWLNDFGFDSFEIYKEEILDEYDDVFLRENLNMLLYDIEMGHLDAVYIEEFKIISPITLKVFQVIMEIQKLNSPIFFHSGIIEPSDQSINQFNKLYISQWEKFRLETESINFEKIIKEQK